MATPFGTATVQLCELLQTAGLEATHDARDLQVPGVWVDPVRADYARLDAGVYVGIWNVHLIAPDNGPAEALDKLSEMAEQLRTVVNVPEAATEAVALPNHAAEPLPALLVTLELEVS